MAKINPGAVLMAAVGYVRKNPDEIVRAAVNATGLRFGIPLASLRWFASQVQGKKAPKEIEIGSTPPALRLSAVVDAMGTPVRASGAVKVDEISVTPDSLRIGFRLNNVKLALAGESEAPIAMLIKSGALDLSKPGNLVKYIPKRPPAIVEAEGDRIVIDLMKVPKLANDPRVKRLISVLTPVIGIGGIETDRDHIYVRLKATPLGLFEAISAFRAK